MINVPSNASFFIVNYTKIVSGWGSAPERTRWGVSVLSRPPYRWYIPPRPDKHVPLSPSSKNTFSYGLFLPIL